MTDDRPVLDQVNVVTRDMDASVAFYRRLGVEIADTEPQWERQHRSAVLPEGVALDIDAHGAVGQQPPWDAFWGARYAVVEDPDGNAVGIMSAIDPDRRGPAPGDA